MKVEVYCRLAGVDYEIKTISDPRKAPKGKLPFIKDGDTIIADSSVILEYLEKKKPSPLTEGLSETDQAHFVAYKRLMEEHLYWTVFYSRWVDDNGWQVIKKPFFKDLPFPLRLFLPDLIRKKCIASVKAQGVGRHSKDEIYALGMQDIKTLSLFLDHKKFFLGDSPKLLDCTAYSFISPLLWGPWDSPLKLFAQKQKNLVDYNQRMTTLVERS